MRLEEWKDTMQTMVDECNHEQEGGGKDRILMAWRAKLEKEPTCSVENVSVGREC